jgi:hypothetical protein
LAETGRIRLMQRTLAQSNYVISQSAEGSVVAGTALAAIAEPCSSPLQICLVAPDQPSSSQAIASQPVQLGNKDSMNSRCDVNVDPELQHAIMHARPKALVDYVIHQEDREEQRDSTWFPAADDAQGCVDALLAGAGIGTGPSGGQEDNNCPDAWASESNILASAALAPKKRNVETNPRVGSSQMKSYNTFHQRHASPLRLVRRKDASATEARADLVRHLRKSVMDTSGAILTDIRCHLVLKLQTCQCFAKCIS